MTYKFSVFEIIQPLKPKERLAGSTHDEALKMVSSINAKLKRTNGVRARELAYVGQEIKVYGGRAE
ncbi:hypothetical protein [Macrococcus brunensis]|uniref:hypothetical protein n=1 Tax=Macrococcus brunensis TaxID=198483 RepID=UPI001EF06AA1|nr:hypothetical protein [Macrococcus brunensis]ULG73008.1 hypothetical protein MGG12_05685 [Macrococcus brunensis]